MASPVPQSTLASLDRVPAQVGAAILLRHAERPMIPPGTDGDEVRLTDAGIADARAFGARLGPRLAGLYASPVDRCMQTARALAEGAGTEMEPEARTVLGSPGPFIVDAEAAFAAFKDVGTMAAARRQVLARGPLPGLRDTEEGVRLVVASLLADPPGAGRLDAHVTHDGVVIVVAGFLAGFAPGPDRWPAFLEGLVLWRDETGAAMAWGGEVFPLPEAVIPRP